MTKSSQFKYPAICFTLLSLTMLLAGLGTLGAFVLLYFYYPSSSTIHTAIVLAVNGLLCWLLAGLCISCAWRLFRQTPKAKSFARVTLMLVACFTLWTLVFDGLSGWSVGGISEVVTWSVFEVLIAIHLILMRHEAVA